MKPRPDVPTASTALGGHLGYTERPDALCLRIKAHQQFSNFSLEDWIERQAPFAAGDILLDIGCGSGNLFPSYAKKLGSQGVIVGLDQSTKLLEQARQSHGDTPKILLTWDMNQAFPFIAEGYDHIISTFAIYYVKDVEQVLKEMRRVLKNDGHFLLIGPSNNNARELYEFNERVFGFDRDEKIHTRTNRLEKEFFPKSQVFFESTSIEVIPSQLVFPDQKAFIDYYLATLLFEESVKTAGHRPPDAELMRYELPQLAISKEMVVVRGRK